MALLSDTFTDLCAKHDLIAVNVGIQIYNDGRAGFGAYAHWLDSNQVRHCESSHGDTPELALTGAIEKANSTRNAASTIEALEVAA